METLTAYLDTFSNHALNANLYAVCLNEKRTQIRYDDRVVKALNRLKQRNEEMVRCNYLAPKIMEQTYDALANPAYHVMPTEQAYIDAYNVVAHSLDFFGDKKDRVRDLDRFVNNAEVYVKQSADLVLFLNLSQMQEMNDADDQAYQANFIKPVQDAITRYRAADTMEAKIAAYKEISAPLRNLSTEMYNRAVKVYPDSYKPSWLNQPVNRLA